MRKIIEERKNNPPEEWNDEDLGMDKGQMNAMFVAGSIAVAIFLGVLAAIVYWALK